MSHTDDPFQEIEELFDQLTQFGGTRSRVAVDVVDEGEEFVVTADLPGRGPESIDVRLEDDRRLHIETEEREKERDGQFLTRERSYEPIHRTVTLPAAVDPEETIARYDQGVLTVTLGKLTDDSGGTDIPVS